MGTGPRRGAGWGLLSTRPCEICMKVSVTQSCLTLCDPMVCQWISPAKNTGVGRHSLLQGIFLTQGSNPDLLHCRLILYRMSYRKSEICIACGLPFQPYFKCTGQ